MKFILKNANKERLLIYGNSYLQQYFSNKIKFETLPSLHHSINLKYLLKAIVKNIFIIFNLKKLRLEYTKEYIKNINPKVIVTYHDNEIFFYKLKNFFPKIKFISLQNGYRFKKNDLFDISIDKNLKCDYIFAFGHHVSEYYKKYIESKIIINGSLKNNSIKVRKSAKKKWCVFISSFGLGNNNSEKKILPILDDFCLKHQLSLKILLRKNLKEEIYFFKKFKFIKNKNLLILDKNTLKSYDILDKSIISISLNATLGYENLARGGKTFFINTKDRDLNCSSFLSYGWPGKYAKSGFFWTNKINRKEINIKLKKILFLKKNRWDKICKNYSKKIIILKKNNNQIDKLIKKLCYD